MVLMKFKNIRKLLAELDGYEINVGWSDAASYENGEKVGNVALYNELGTSTIPARPFMRAAINASQGEIKQGIANALKKVINGTDIKMALSGVADIIINEIDDQIVNGKFKDNAESTIKGKGFNKPLVDTGLMRQSLTSSINKGNN
jgi:phage gpG-like protein